MELFHSQCILLLLQLVNLAMNGLGFFLLWRSYKNVNRTVQHLCIINLSFSQLLKNIVYITCNILSLTRTETTSTVDDYIFTRYVAVPYFIAFYHLSMLMLMADRLFITAGGIRYRNYWEVEKMKVLLNVFWCSGVY